jgi:hypothetical protein
MRKLVLGAVLVPVLVVGAVRGARFPNSAHAASARDGVAIAVSRALEGRFVAPASRTAHGSRPAVARRVCEVTAPNLGEHVYYQEESFAASEHRPFAAALLIVTPVDGTHARITELRPRDTAALAGTCDRTASSTRAAPVLAEPGCVMIAEVRPHGLTAHTEGDRCPSVLNGASHRTRTLTVDEGSLAVLDLGLTRTGAIAWGDPASPVRYRRVPAAR